MPKPLSRKAVKDWHRADIKGRLDKRGYSFARIARENGYVSNAPNTVLRRPWPKMERIVAGIIGVKPQTIWPSRHDKTGQPHRTKIYPPGGRLAMSKTARQSDSRQMSLLDLIQQAAALA